VDQQTKTALKKDKFVTTTNEGIEWAGEHRRSVIINGAIALGVIVVVVIAGVIYNSRSNAASTAFGEAMQVYQTPLGPSESSDAGAKTYATAAERSKAAGALFQAVADKYGCTSAGENALYFAGLTYIESGENQRAEDTLKKVAKGWDGSLSGLAKFTLAQFYHNNGRDPEAIEIYTKLTKRPAATVPVALAQLQLADLYQAEGKSDEAKAIYATLKQNDPKSVAGEMAAEKLNPTASSPAGQ